jgi:hypothetical protein
MRAGFLFSHVPSSESRPGVPLLSYPPRPRSPGSPCPARCARSACPTLWWSLVLSEYDPNGLMSFQKDPCLGRHHNVAPVHVVISFVPRHLRLAHSLCPAKHTAVGGGGRLNQQK